MHREGVADPGGVACRADGEYGQGDEAFDEGGTGRLAHRVTMLP